MDEFEYLTNKFYDSAISKVLSLFKLETSLSFNHWSLY